MVNVRPEPAGTVMEPEATAFAIGILNRSAGEMSGALTWTTMVAVPVAATSARTNSVASGCDPSPTGSCTTHAPRARSVTSAGTERRI